MEQIPSEQSKPCPHCGLMIRRKALQCGHCGKWMPEAVGPVPSFEPQDASYSNGQSIRHLILLSVLTFGLYEIYWFYRNWKAIRDHTGMAISPGWRVFGLGVPFVNIFMVYHQFKLVRDLADTVGLRVTYAPRALTFGYFALVTLSNLSIRLWMLSLLTVVLLLPVQEALNGYWAREQEGTRIREQLSSGEFAILLLGGLMTAMAVAGTLSLLA